MYSSEGHILLAGIGLALLYLSFLSLTALVSPGLAQSLVGITATNVIYPSVNRIVSTCVSWAIRNRSSCARASSYSRSPMFPGTP